jgi:large subunit ribosomal protein L22
MFDMEAKAILRDCPTSPQKMRLLADMIRGRKVDQAQGLLKFSKKDASARLEKLLLSAVANWERKNEDQSLESAELYVKQIFVDGGRMLKRLRPAPQGRGHRILKRSNHITLVVDAKNAIQND